MEFLKKLFRPNKILPVEEEIISESLPQEIESSPDPIDQKIKELLGDFLIKAFTKTPVSDDELSELVDLGPQAIKPLMGTLTDTDYHRADISVRALAMFGEPAINALVGGTMNENPVVREWAACALAKMNKSDNLHYLIPLFDDTESRVRRVAVQGAGDLGNIDAIEHLVIKLDDDEHNVRREAVAALKKLSWTPTNKKQEIVFAVAGEYALTRLSLKKIIAYGDLAVEPLIVALKTDLKYAAQALGEIGDQRARGPLSAALYLYKDDAVKKDIEIALDKLRIKARGEGDIALTHGISGEKIEKGLNDGEINTRHGKCSDCNGIICLKDAVKVYMDWGGTDAYKYLCPSCYKDDGHNLFGGDLVDKYGEKIIDQHS